MNPKKKINIWTIVLFSLIIITLIFLIYNWWFGVSSNLTLDKWLEGLEKARSKGAESEIKAYVLPNQTRGIQAVWTSGVESSSVYFHSVEGLLEKLELKVSDFDQTKIVYEQSLPSSLLFSVFSIFVSFFPLLFIGFWIWMMMRRGSMSGFGSGGLTLKSKKSKIRFLDVAGIEEEKKELLEIVDFLKVPGKYLKMGARIPKGLLLYGPPGTGKTLLAKAVSGESGVPFFSMAGSEFEEVFVGMGASRIRELFKKAKAEAPCIIFIDEVDSLGGNRNQMGGARDQTLNQFLSEMDGFETTDGVIIIAATNRADVLDPAMLRSGRFDRKIQINLPDVREREAILEIHMRNKNIEKNLSVKGLAERTPGFSGAQLENSLNEAALVAVRNNQTIIKIKDIDEGIDRVIGGPSKNLKVINEKTRLIVALHEAGHALMGLLLDDALQVQKITIIPRGSAGGYTITTPKDETLINSKESLYHHVTGFLGGRAAEEIELGPMGITTGAHDDFAKATEIAKKMVKEFGMSDDSIRSFVPSPMSNLTMVKDISEAKLKNQDEEIDKILNSCFQKAREVLKKNRPLLHLIAEALLILETIVLKDIKYIYQERKLPTEALKKKAANLKKIYFDLTLLKKKKSQN